MNRLNFYVPVLILNLVWQWVVFPHPAAFAKDGPGEAIDCTDVSVNYEDDPTLTQEERIRRMDKAFQESLDKFELCRAARALATSSGAGATGTAGANGDSKGSGGEGAKGDSQGSAGETDGTAMGESVASSSMSGTEAAKTTSLENGLEAGEPSGMLNSPDNNTSGRKTVENMRLSSGKAPEDIPSARNDDSLAAQIRYAAETETDPEKKKRLWNEYRKYKGLPTK